MYAMRYCLQSAISCIGRMTMKVVGMYVDGSLAGLEWKKHNENSVSSFLLEVINSYQNSSYNAVI